MKKVLLVVATILIFLFVAYCGVVAAFYDAGPRVVFAEEVEAVEDVVAEEAVVDANEGTDVEEVGEVAGDEATEADNDTTSETAIEGETTEEPTEVEEPTSEVIESEVEPTEDGLTQVETNTEADEEIVENETKTIGQTVADFTGLSKIIEEVGFAEVKIFLVFLANIGAFFEAVLLSSTKKALKAGKTQRSKKERNPGLQHKKAKKLGTISSQPINQENDIHHPRGGLRF